MKTNDTKIVYVTAEVNLTIRVPSEWGDDEINDAMNDMGYDFILTDPNVEMRDCYIPRYDFC